MRKEKTNHIVLQILFWITAAVYLLALLRASLFKVVHFSELFTPDRFFTRGVNWIPFHHSGTPLYAFRKDIIINFIMYMPFGFMLSMKTANRKHYGRYLLIPFVFCMVMETLQYVLQVGMFDITDIIMNCVGAILGFAGYRILTHIFKKNPERLNFVLTLLMFLVAAVVLILMI